MGCQFSAIRKVVALPVNAVRRLRRRFRRNSATPPQRRSRSVPLCDKNGSFVTSGREMKRNLLSTVAATAVIAAASAASGSEPVTLVGTPNVGCPDKAVMEKFYQAASETHGDQAAERKLITTALTNYGCKMFDRGDVVITGDTSASFVTVRKKGEMQSYWIRSNGLTDEKAYCEAVVSDDPLVIRTQKAASGPVYNSIIAGHSGYDLPQAIEARRVIDQARANCLHDIRGEPFALVSAWRMIWQGQPADHEYVILGMFDNRRACENDKDNFSKNEKREKEEEAKAGVPRNTQDERAWCAAIPSDSPCITVATTTGRDSHELPAFKEADKACRSVLGIPGSKRTDPAN